MIKSRWNIGIGVAAALMVSPAISACSREPSKPGDRVISTRPDDEAMNGAIKQAVSTLDVFWREFDRKAPGVTDFAVKLKMTGQDGFQEHIWAYVIGRDDGEVIAELVNEPEHLRGLTTGSKVRVSQSLISDWSYVKNGESYGQYTTRVLLPRMSPEERAQVQLSPTPLEPSAS